MLRAYACLLENLYQFHFMSHQINGPRRTGFGAEFPIYQKHPNASIVAICQRSEDSLNKVGDEFNIELSKLPLRRVVGGSQYRRTHQYANRQPRPISIQALKREAVACTVPMATSVEECQQIRTSEETG